MKIRKSNERGDLKIDWLHAKHSFSFGSFYDPDFMNFKSLRVINNDIIQPKSGFDTHSHSNMEIITFVLSGALDHRDGLGNHSTIKPGEVQLMSAGSGISHSEFNLSDTLECELYQIWIETNQKNTLPSYEQYSYADRKKINSLTLLVSPYGEASEIGVAKAYANIKLYLGSLEDREKIKVDSSKSYWLQIISGSLSLNEDEFNKADGVGFEINELDEIIAIKKCDFLLFEFND